MSSAIKLVGLDCGSTTTSLVVAAARLAQGALGRVRIADLEETYRSPIVFTPFCADVPERIDAQRLAGYLDAWLAAAGIEGQGIFGGGRWSPAWPPKALTPARSPSLSKPGWPMP